MSSGQMPRRRRTDKVAHSVAFWAALTAFFTNLIAVKFVSLISGDGDVQSISAAFLTSLVVAAGVYTKQRYDDAKAEENRLRKNGTDIP